jgi:hypothetical protein
VVTLRYVRTFGALGIRKPSGSVHCPSFCDADTKARSPSDSYSTIALMMETVSTSETSICFYESSRGNAYK